MTLRVDSFVTAAEVRAWEDWSEEGGKGMYIRYRENYVVHN